MTKATTILSGNFSTGDNAQGNFSGYNSKGERIFIFKQQMAGVGFNKEADVKYPFFVLTNEREIETRDESGELTGTMVKRVQATAVFTDRAKLIEAKNSDALLEIESSTALVTAATTAGLSKEQVTALLEVSI